MLSDEEKARLARWATRRPASFYSDHPNAAAGAARLYERLRTAPTLEEDEIDQLFLPPQPACLLTYRERQFLGAAAVGWSRRRTADYLGLSANTIGTHAKKVYAKLGLANLADQERDGSLAATAAVATAIRNGWI